jgi:hypothetical protein
VSLIALAGVTGIGTVFMLRVLKALVVDLRGPRLRTDKLFRKSR